MEDRLLVFRCKKGSSDAMCRIYSKYRDHLLILAVSLSHNASLAEDAVHDVFVGFAQNISTFNLTGSLKAYLAICVANRVRDLIQSRQNKTISLPQDDQTVNTDDPARRIICNERLHQLSAALDQLPGEQKEVIALHIFSGISIRSIARTQGLSVNTVKGRYRYGINKLRSILK